MKKQGLSADIKKQIQKIQLYTNRLVKTMSQGEHQTRKRGPGFLFDQLRDYYQGDDIRFIDWNASARMNTLLIKQYQEERNKQIVIAVDISLSQQFGHSTYDKLDCMNTVAAVFAWVAHLNHDQVGLVLFSDHIEYYLPCNMGLIHAQKIIEEIFSRERKGCTTKLQSVFEFLPRHIPRNAMIILISDFIDDAIEQRMIKKIGVRYDVIAVRCLDQYEIELPDIGFLTIEDLENGKSCVIDTRKKSSNTLKQLLNQRIQQQELLFKRSRISLLDLESSQPFIPKLVRFFYKRMNY